MPSDDGTMSNLSVQTSRRLTVIAACGLAAALTVFGQAAPGAAADARPRVSPVCELNLQLSGTTVTVPAGGGLRISVGGETYHVESTYTCLTRAYRLLVRSVSGGWRPEVSRVDGGTALQVVAAGAEYRLTRTIRLRGDRIEINDEVTNVSGDDAALLLEHELIVPRPPGSFRLQGTYESRVAARSCPENPTLFVAQERSGLGWVAEDDVLRLQMGSEAEGNRIRAFGHNFGLAAGKSYTFKFALYPTGTDFFQFLNAVRRDWGVNFTVPGPFEWVSAYHYQQPADADKLRALVARKHIRIFAIDPWFEFNFSQLMSREEFKALHQRAMHIIKSVVPDAICLGQIETNLVPQPFTFFKGTLPTDLPYGRPGTKYPIGISPGNYNWPAPLAASAIVNESPWKDSVFRDGEGHVMLDTYCPDRYVEPPVVNFKVYPAPGNCRMTKGLEQIAFLLDDVGFDGVYIDQFSLAFNLEDHFTYDRWDGCTVDVDPATGRIVRKYADVALIGGPARQAWIGAVLSRGKVLVANSMPAAMEEQSLPVLRFMETQGYDPLAPGIPDPPHCFEGMLGSPIGLAPQWWDYQRKQTPGAEFYMRTVCAQLRYGLLYYWYSTEFPPQDGEYGPVNHMFPFTPIALHEGWVEGKERTITCISGTFQWRRPRKPVVRLFDRRGREKAADAHTAEIGDGFEVRIQLDDWHEIAVIE